MTTTNDHDVAQLRLNGLDKARAALAANRAAISAKVSVALRLEERARIAQERAARLTEQLERKRALDAKRAQKALKEDAFAHGIGGCHKRITALEARIAYLENALGASLASSNGAVVQ